MSYIYEKNTDGFPVIHIEGKLDDIDKIVKLIPEFYNIHNEDKTPGLNFYKSESVDKKDKQIILDLSKVDLISNECLKLFQKYKSIYNLKFQNYSLYIEMQLEEFGLLK